jgi:hypothetical protein
MLRRHKPEVLEAQPALPHNHHALLRFRSNVVSQATGIPFKEVSVQKAVCTGKHTLSSQTNIGLNNAYSLKVTGKIYDRSIITLDSGKRYIAPGNFIELLADGLDIRFNSTVGNELKERTKEAEPLISTMPMPAMMELMSWHAPCKFNARKIWAINAELPDCDVYQTIYYPGAEPYYRASITGNRLTVEAMEEPKDALVWLESVQLDMGIISTDLFHIEVKEQRLGKLQPLADPSMARTFVLFLTDCHRIYSVGRFALWRNLLLDDVCRDIQTVERLIDFRDDYQKHLVRI